MPADTRPGSTIYRLLDDDDDKGDDGDDKGDGDDGGGNDFDDDQSKAHESDLGDPRFKMNIR